MPIVRGVAPGGIAEEGGVVPGDVLLAVNGEPINDVFDYRYHISAVAVEMLFRGADGDEYILEAEKAEDDDPGLTFDSGLMDEPRACANRCVFCFMDQLPSGLRAPLYFKDDDVRLSFLNGNYVTLTNVNKDDLSRIVRYGLSPVNISVHTTDAALRAKMMGGRACDVLPALKYLTESGISINAQIVLCIGYNDGAALDATLADLRALNNRLISVSVVPSGLTRYREGLTPLRAFGAEEALRALDQITVWQKRFMQSHGRRVVYPADEFYMLCDKKIPGLAAYEGCPQLENGVGMIALFKKQFSGGLRRLSRRGDIAQIRERARDLPPAYVCTGTAAAGMLACCAEALARTLPGLNVIITPVENEFFGGGVTVAGLLTGRDILNRLKRVKFPVNSRVLVSKTMLKHDSELLLDDFTLDMLRNLLNVDIIAVENNGSAFIRAILA